MPQSPVFQHEVKYSGKTLSQKAQLVQDKLKDAKIDVLLVTTLDDINWLLNLRGADIKCNPVFFSYMIIHIESGAIDLFINKSKLSQEIISSLQESKVTIREYEEVASHLKELAEQGKKIGYDENICNQKLFESFESSSPVH